MLTGFQGSNADFKLNNFISDFKAANKFPQSEENHVSSLAYGAAP